MPTFPDINFKRGDKGPDREAHIRTIQKALGLGLGGQTGVFGPTTEQLVVNLQRARGLEVDGVIGKDTWAALFRPAPISTADLGERALAKARTFLHVRERPLGSNRGPEIDAWNRSAGAPVGGFWCMSFVHGMVLAACGELGLASEERIPKTASCSALFRWARERDRLATRPRRGDVFLVIGGDTGHFHTGFVAAAPDGRGRFETIEGNSNAGGAPNGVGVFHRRIGRRLSSCHFVAL